MLGPVPESFSWWPGSHSSLAIGWLHFELEASTYLPQNDRAAQLKDLSSSKIYDSRILSLSFLSDLSH